MNKLAEQIIVDILKTEMDLPINSVWVRDQNKEIPKDNGLYIIVGLIDSNYISSTNDVIPHIIPGTPPIQAMKEVQKIITRDNIQIDILSRSNDATLRRWELMAALKSVYSVQKQEENFFKIFSIPSSFLNTSDAEGGSQINRFSLTIPCHVWYIKEAILYDGDGYDFYDKFKTRVDDYKTISEDTGLIEFEINGA